MVRIVIIIRGRGGAGEEGGREREGKREREREREKGNLLLNYSRNLQSDNLERSYLNISMQISFHILEN